MAEVGSICLFGILFMNFNAEHKDLTNCKRLNKDLVGILHHQVTQPAPYVWKVNFRQSDEWTRHGYVRSFSTIPIRTEGVNPAGIVMDLGSES